MKLEENHKYYILIEDVREPLFIYIYKNGAFQNEKTLVKYPIEKIIDYCHVESPNLKYWKARRGFSDIEKIEDYKVPIEICNKYGIDLIGLSKSLFDLLSYVNENNFNSDLNKVKQHKKKEIRKCEIAKLNNQKDIALSFIGKPTKKKHYKSIIAIYEQYEKELNKSL